jgi:F-type H+-transporting ATPase subunit delta
LAAQNSVLVHIARPYASALFELASEAGQIQAIEANFATISALIGDSPDFSRFLFSPAIPADVKAAAMDTILAKGKADPLLSNFIKLVAKNGRLFVLPAIIADFRTRAAKARGEVSAEVTSAAPLSEQQISRLAETLKAKIGKTVTLIGHVDPTLIGGLVVKVGSQMIDSSLKTKLAAMKIAMKEVR